MRKKNKRKDHGCHPQCHYMSSREHVDYDYVDKLTDEEAEWLGNFSDNYYSGRFKSDDSKNPIKDRKECYRRAHAQRRDFISGRTKSRLDLSADQAVFIEVVDVEVAKAYLESRASESLESSDED